MRSKTLGLLTLVLSLTLAACGDDGTSIGSPGTLSLMLTDGPGDFTQARVMIERIELVGGGEPLVLVLRDTPFSTDLLTLSNDVVSLVEGATVPAGTYSQLRLIIPGACIGVEQDDGSEKIYASSGFNECGAPGGSLQLPSFAQTGIKVNLPGGSIEVDGDARILLLDFDVSQSFGQQAGASGMWVMTPVINAADMSLTGNIVVELTVAATVGSSLADFEAELSTETEPQTFVDPDGDGVFTASFLFLLPDPDPPYEVAVVLREGVSFDFTLDPISPQSVPLSSAEEVLIAFEVTSAAPTP